MIQKEYAKRNKARMNFILKKYIANIKIASMNIVFKQQTLRCLTVLLVSYGRLAYRQSTQPTTKLPPFL